jgi:hypothetical protein
MLQPPPGGPIHLGKCPWCYSEQWHERVEKCYFSRDVYKCPHALA